MPSRCAGRHRGGHVVALRVDRAEASWAVFAAFQTANVSLAAASVKRTTTGVGGPGPAGPDALRVDRLAEGVHDRVAGLDPADGGAAVGGLDVVRRRRRVVDGDREAGLEPAVAVVVGRGQGVGLRARGQSRVRGQRRAAEPVGDAVDACTSRPTSATLVAPVVIALTFALIVGDPARDRRRRRSRSRTRSTCPPALMNPASYWPVLAMTVAETVGATVSRPANDAAVVRTLAPSVALPVNRASDADAGEPIRLTASASGRDAGDRPRPGSHRPRPWPSRPRDPARAIRRAPPSPRSRPSGRPASGRPTRRRWARPGRPAGSRASARRR